MSEVGYGMKSFLCLVSFFAAFYLILTLKFLYESSDTLDEFSIGPNQNANHEIARDVGIRAKSSQPYPLAPRYMRILLSSWPELKLNDILFYEFNTSKNITDFILSKNEHETETKSLTNINRKTDELIKTRGDSLFAFNLLVSNRVGAIRRLPDTRHDRCYKSELSESVNSSPQVVNHWRASIVICYYNEAPSALLRTINSIIIRSPQQLVEEIIIVDDYSQPEYALQHILSYILPTTIRIINTKTSRREGLIRARLHGAGLARGQVLIFLDSHVEANVGWLEPLMSAVQANSTTIACPIIDLINAETMIYSASPLVKGGLNWALHFKWDSVPSDQLKTAEDFARPINSPTMAGGLYAINRDYFYHIGSYDNKMDLWGGENIEMSLRVWMCGGRIQILPCSRLGHIFRKVRPYGLELHQPDSLLVNSYRTAQVWLDSYIEKFIDHYPHVVNLNVGDINDRLNLRKRLNCENFTWFLDNIYPQLKETLNNHRNGEIEPVDPDISTEARK